MDQTVATNDAPTKDRKMPPMFRLGELAAPKAPQTIAAALVEKSALTELALKHAFTTARFSTDSMAKALHLSLPLAAAVIDLLCREALVEETMKTDQLRSHFRITDQGRTQGTHAMEVCSYVGPAPVSLESYAAMLRWQFAHTPPVQPEHVNAALAGLVLSPEAVQLAGLAISSGRSLFLYGPSGNGKSSIGRQLHTALPGDYWIPYCLSVGNTIIRVFDEQIHQRVEVAEEKPGTIDRRWVRIRRPLVIVGGELTLDLLDLIYSPALGYYEAPPHLKANGGVFLVDDFGRERIAPEQLLNRFITPMEHQIDYFTLRTGQKIQVPLRHVLIIATNMSLEKVTDPAFLRRMGYRLNLTAPTPEQYTRIFQNYAHRRGVAVAPEVVDRLLERYRAENRELRACEPRDLIERSRDICRFRSKSLELTPEVLDLAWIGYFGSESRGKQQGVEDGKGDPGTKEEKVDASRNP
jgi:hypothetical protein